MNILKVYDNGGETVDRYTIIFNSHDMKLPPHYDCLALSSRPTHPQGFSQWGSCVLGNHMGKEIDFTDLPTLIQEHIKQRIGE